MLPPQRWCFAATAAVCFLLSAAHAQTGRPPPTVFAVPLAGYRLVDRVPTRANEAREVFDFARVLAPCTSAAIRVRNSEIDVFEVLFTFVDRTTFAPVGVFFFREGAMTRELARPDVPRPISRLTFGYRNPSGTLGDIEVWCK